MVKLKWRRHVDTGSVNRKDVACESTKSLASNIASLASHKKETRYGRISGKTCKQISSWVFFMSFFDLTVAFVTLNLFSSINLHC